MNVIRRVQYWLPIFRKENILREQIRLIHNNYVVAVIAYWLTSLIASIVVYLFSNDLTIFIWLTGTSAITVYSLLHYFRLAKNFNPLAEARYQTGILFVMGSLFGLLSIIYIKPDSDPVLLAYIIMLSAGAAAGALVMQAPCLPVYTAFLLSSMPGPFVGFLILGGVYYGIVAAIVIYILVLYYCGYNMERTVKHSIELRFANVDLIDKLQSAVGSAEKANRDKSVFLASASHDLRQPLHAMGLFIETMGQLDLNQQQTNVLKHINLASDATRDMLNTLLNFSKLDAGVIEPTFEAVDLQNLLAKLEQELGATADGKQLFYRSRETNLVAHTDPALLELILRNIISNAIRYTKTGGLLVSCRRRDNYASIEVWDTGIGIPDTEQGNIFKEFHQLGNPERDRQKGFGLGLAIVKGLCETLGAELILNSRLGKGSTFKIVLPLSNEPIISDALSTIDEKDFIGLHFLFIDDDESIRAAMKSLLNSWGSYCTTAESLDHALFLKENNNTVPDVLIVDYRLRENKTGGEAIIALRKHFNKKVPAVIVTGDTAADRLREAQEYDATLLHKPVVVSELQIAIKDLLRKA